MNDDMRNSLSLRNPPTHIESDMLEYITPNVGLRTAEWCVDRLGRRLFPNRFAAVPPIWGEANAQAK